MKALVGGTLIDGKGGSPVADSVVVINDEGSIEAVGPRDAIGLHPSWEVVRIEGLTLLPGLIDCHVHITAAGDPGELATGQRPTLARRAYRRPVTDSDLEVPLNLYRDGARRGGFESGIDLALRGILVSPNFLFRFEEQPTSIAPETPYRISDLELASRLSFFLWSSIPDDELLDVATKEALNNPEVLHQQVRRMLEDSRSQALVDNFAGQWLSLRSVAGIQPDPNLFPEFDENLRVAMRRETELLLTDQLSRDLSVVDLLRADYTFLNERLAQHYGIAGVLGSHYRRVPLPDNRRGGLLGHSSILAVTSYGNRTSPVLRAKWLLENVFGTPPSPPPPDVPALPDAGSADAPRTVEGVRADRAPLRAVVDLELTRALVEPQLTRLKGVWSFW